MKCEFPVHELRFSGRILARGYWLYVVEVAVTNARTIYYVGRTGDSSSICSQSPFHRVGQHLGGNTKVNALTKYILGKHINISNCDYRFVTIGPIFPDAKGNDERHQTRKKANSALEKHIAELFLQQRREVNTVHSRCSAEKKLLEAVERACKKAFPQVFGE